MIKRDAWIEINTDNIRFNINQIKSKAEARGAEVVGVIKANAYGHGVVDFAAVLKEEGINCFAVATLKEAVELREAGFVDERIIILGIVPDCAAKDIVAYNITRVICTLSGAVALSKAAVEENKKVDCLIAIDTGMGRIGYSDCKERNIEEIKEISKLDNINIYGLFSHFASSDAADKSFAILQHVKYESFDKKISETGIRIPNKMLANSAAIIEMPTTYYDYVRPGIILYGIYPSKEVDKKKMELRPVMSVKARIIYIKTVHSGTSIGYGRTFIAEGDREIATLPLGYADGIPRLLSNKGKVIIRGNYADIVGNVCMDQLMIDITGIPDVKIGDEVVLMGSEDDLQITADDIADIAQTIPYEIVCGLGQRLEKKLI